MDNDTFVNVDELIDDSTANFFMAVGVFILLQMTTANSCDSLNNRANGNQFISSEI